MDDTGPASLRRLVLGASSVNRSGADYLDDVSKVNKTVKILF